MHCRRTWRCASFASHKISTDRGWVCTDATCAGRRTRRPRRPSEFLSQLRAAGLDPKCETVTTTFEFANFQDAWDALAGVTTAALEPKVQDEAKAAICELMWPDPGTPQTFRNSTQLIYARKAT